MIFIVFMVHLIVLLFSYSEPVPLFFAPAFTLLYFLNIFSAVISCLSLCTVHLFIP